MRPKSFKSQCTKILLQGAGDDHKFLNIAPTMKRITHEGRTYFQCLDSMGQDPTDGQWGLLYLWDGWGAWRMQQFEAEEAASKAGTP
jgi:hypothetical protein